MTTTPWDPGLQNERTGLAWQRTMLSGLACSLLVARVLASVSVLLALAVGLLALLTTAGLGWVAIRRFRTNDAALRIGQPVSRGAPVLLLTVVVSATAVAALVYVVAG